MRNNIPREDLDAVIAYLQQDDPILTNGAQCVRVRAGMVGVARRASTACSSTPAPRRTC